MTKAKKARHHDLDIGFQFTRRCIGSGECGESANAVAIADDKRIQSVCDRRIATGFRKNLEGEAAVALDDRVVRNRLDRVEYRMPVLFDRAENRVHLRDARLRILLDQGEDNIVLAFEQPIDLADADRRLGSKFGGRRGVKPLGVEQLAGRLDDPLSWHLLLRLLSHPHAWKSVW